MKFLRRIYPGPNVLSSYDFNTQTWDDVSSSDKKDIWVDLVKMQGKVCAYCERKINLTKEGDKHIEHFKRKGIHRELTFNWENLFGSCGEKQRCGFYKDKQEYNEGDLLKADEMDPEDFFCFYL
ncbi:retron system putative HNH endonuclease [Escherichia coli]|uniref:retron system putative HNH endonuclease n=1 Tax=Escherichia coli TaxID=562 RepID=UPI00384660D6